MENTKTEFSNLKNPPSHNDSVTKPLSGKDDQEDSLFDNLMVEIGNDGKFQKRFNIIYNFLFIAVLTMPYFNIILSMTIPDHWCHVPGRELTNYSLEEWKAKWSPMTKSSNIKIFNSCKMYAENNTDQIIGKHLVSRRLELAPSNMKLKTLYETLSNVSRINKKAPPVKEKYCQHGWDFDRQWYTETVVTEANWVCDREIHVSNTFAASRVGEIIGTFIFGQLGDGIGRKPVFYISVFILVLGRLAFTFTSGYYYVFLFSTALGSLACATTFQSPLVISMEVSDERKRSQIAFLQCFGWVVGLCILTFLVWALKDWKIIMLASTIPSILPFFCYNLLPESPRWLASKGRVMEAVKVLKYIAKVNKSRIPKNTFSVLEKIGNKKEKVYGLATLFANWRLAKNTIIIVVNWSVSSFIYYVITLSVTNMSGNPFLNFFWQSVVEIPGYILGKVLSDKIGRRWTQSGSFFAASIACISYLFFLTFRVTHLEIYFLAMVKLLMTITFYMVWLQAIEIYPTCVRQTGTSIGNVLSNIVGIFGPYVVYLGTSIDMRIPYGIVLVLTILAGISSSFLPETLNEKLPETIEDAKIFGKNQKYWSFSKKK